MEEVLRIKDAYRKLDGDSKNREKWSVDNLGNLMALRERRNTLERLLSLHGYFPLKGKRILDIGSGFGRELAFFQQLGAEPENLHGIDLSEERVGEARKEFPSIHFNLGNAESLPFPDGYFDLICFSTVFSSILSDTTAQNVAEEAKRALKPGGSILWYDFRYPSHSNRSTRPISKKQMRSLFAGYRIQALEITVLPPLVRALGRMNAYLYPWLARIPFLNSHYMAVLKKEL